MFGGFTSEQNFAFSRFPLMLSFTFVTLIQSINADELEETSNDQMAHTLNETSGLLLRLLNRSCRSSRSISILIYKVKSSPRTIDFFHTVTMEYLANLAFFLQQALTFDPR